VNDPSAISATILVSPLLDSHEVANYLKVSESTLSRWRTERKGPPFVRLGGIARYRLDSVDQWLSGLEIPDERVEA
jgi:excisionase family DNA binding protein